VIIHRYNGQAAGYEDAYGRVRPFNGLDGYDDFGFSIGKTLKKVGSAAKAVSKVALAPVLTPVNIVKDAKKYGIKTALKRAPSRILMDSTINATRAFTATANVFTTSDRTILGKSTKKVDKVSEQYRTWTQEHPVYTVGIAAAAVGAVIAAPAAIAAVSASGASIGGAASSAGIAAAKQLGKDVALPGVMPGVARAPDKGGTTEIEVDPTLTPEALTKVQAAGGVMPKPGGTVPLLAGAGIGFAVGGPVGAIVGAIAGSLMGKR
jgi:hypothetical protein